MNTTIILYGGPSECEGLSKRGAVDRVACHVEVKEAQETGIHLSPSNFLRRVQLKHAHACDRAIRTKAALSFGQRSINLTNSRLLSILAATPMLTITQRSEAQAKLLVCVRARVCVPRVAFVCVF